MFSTIATNLTGNNTRRQTMEGKEYLVVPSVMLTPGVFAGSKGPLLYLPEELSKDPVVWNHKPAMVYHPTLNGEGISACDPDVIDKQKCGLVMGSSYDGRLKNETWIDIEKTKIVDNRILTALAEGKTIEVSTGMYHDLQEVSGEYNGKKYIGIVRNIRPDHLAILPDQVGACSVADGAGLLRNAAKPVGMEELSYDNIREQLRMLLRGGEVGYCYICDLYAKSAVYEKDDKAYRVAYKIKAGKVILDGTPEEVRKVTKYVTVNGKLVGNESMDNPLALPASPGAGQLSDVMRRQQLETALQALYSDKQEAQWVVEVFANFAVYSKDGKLFRLPYEYADDKITTIGKTEEVEKFTDYRPKPPNMNQGTTVTTPVNNAVVQGATGLVDSNPRKAAVSTLVGKGWAETDRAWLEALPEDQFERISKHTNKDAAGTAAAQGAAAIQARTEVVPSMNQLTNNTQGMTVEQYIAAAPAEVAEILQNALATTAAEKTRLVETILTNKANQFTKEWLLAQKTPLLRGLAALAVPQQTQQRPVNNYSGQAEPPMFVNGNNTPLTNAVDENVPVLPMPGPMFGPKKTA